MKFRVMKENPIQIKSYSFAVSIVKVYKKLMDQKEYVLARQILRSGTSIGSNVEEAIGAQSNRDFYTRITIAYKEARESHYWLRLLSETDYLRKTEGEILIGKADELVRILGSIQKTMKQKINT